MRRRAAFLSLIAAAIWGCSSFAEPAPDIPATIEAVVETKVAEMTANTAPFPALSESGAMSILRHYLLSCIASWRPAAQTPEQAGLPAVRERWSVIGAGFESIEPALIPAPRTWLVTAGRRIARPLDGPATLADLEYRRLIPLKDGSRGDCGAE